MAVDTLATDKMTDWPGAFGLFKPAKLATYVNGWTLFWLDVVSFVLSSLQHSDQHHQVVWPLALIALLLSMLIQLAITVVAIAGARGQKLDFATSLSKAAHYYVNGFLASVLTVAILAVSLLLFVIPFFFVLPRIILATYFVVDQDMGPVEALQASWEHSRGHSLKAWGVVGVTILFAVLCVVLVGFYLLFVYQTALALLYTYVASHTEVPTQTAS